MTTENPKPKLRNHLQGKDDCKRQQCPLEYYHTKEELSYVAPEKWDPNFFDTLFTDDDFTEGTPSFITLVKELKERLSLLLSMTIQKLSSEAGNEENAYESVHISIHRLR